MLNTMRTLSKSVLSKLLMLLLVVSFGVWGVGDILKSGGAASYAAKVGSDTVTVGDFQHQRALLQRQLEGMGIKGLPPGKLEITAIRQLVTQKLTLLAMQDMGLYVNDETVAKSLAAMPDLQDEHGKFSKSRFNFFLEKQRIPEKTFISDYKRELAMNFLNASLDMGDAAAPSSILALQATGAGETRDVVLITVPATDALDGTNEQALKDYYDTHKLTDYLRPETRDLEYVTLTPADVDALASKAVTEQMVTDAAAQRKNASKSEIRSELEKEQRDSVMRDLSNTVEDELAAGKSIGEAFTKAGIKAAPRTLTNTTADMAKTSNDDVTRTVIEQGFSLNEGEVSHLITSKKGALLMVSAKKINAASPKPYDEVKADVKSHLGKELALDAARTKAVAVKQALAKSPNWQAVTDEKKLPTRVVAHLGRAMEGHAPVEGVPPALQQSIFQHNVNEVAGPMTMSNGDQVLAYITAAHLPQVNIADVKATKETAAMGKELGQNVEAHAYQAFSEKHPVDINPAIMHLTGEQE